MLLLLASASPARLATLKSAGISPLVMPTGVDEDGVLADTEARLGPLEPVDVPLVLARAKAEAATEFDCDADLVLGCDSVFELDGAIYGKPGDGATATARLHQMSGRAGLLHTGHWLIDTRPDGSGATLGATSTTVVHIAEMTEAEIEAYVASGEPLAVAGSFTIDGLGGPFVTRVEGDPHGVVGLSLPLFRELLTEIGVSIPQLWDLSNSGS